MKVLRNELKYYIPYTDYKLITSALSQALKKDKHSKKEGGYFIRSLYFDTIENKAFYEKIDGLFLKTKYRMRLYNLDDKEIKFEIKNKIKDKLIKETAFIKKKDVIAVINGNYEVLLNYNNKILNKIYIAFKKDLYRPVAIIDYFREAYVCDLNRIRITFDHQLSKNTKDFDLFSGAAYSKSLLKKGHIIMEIKYNYYLPTWIKTMLQSIRHTRGAISKFAMGRMGELR